MTEYTDAELADMCERAADLLKDNAYPDTSESIQIAAARLRARSEDTERLDWLSERCTGASNSDRYLPFRVYWGDGRGIRAAIDSARKRGE